MKKILFFFIALLIGGGLTIWVFNMVGWEEIRAVFFIFSWWQGLIIIFITCLILFAGVWKWQVILKGHEYSVSIKQLAGSYLASFSVSFFFPMVFFGGEILRGYFLKDKLAIPWGKAISVVVIDRVLETTVFLITIIVGILYFILTIGFLPLNLEVILIATLFVFSAATGFFYFKVFKKESIVRIFLNFFNPKQPPNGQPIDIEKEMFSFFRFKKKIFFAGIFLAFFRVGVTALRSWLLIFFLGKHIGFFPVLSVLGFDYFAYLVPIPTALGIHELAQLFAFGYLGIGKVLAPAFTMIQRGAELTLALLGLVLFFIAGFNILKNVIIEKLGKLINSKVS